MPPRKPNYYQERQDRDRAKAAKSLRKAAAKAEQRDRDRGQRSDKPPTGDSES